MQTGRPANSAVSARAVIPKEHGAWAILLVPFFSTLFSVGAVSLDALLALCLLLSGFFARSLFFRVLRFRAGKTALWRGLLAIFLGACIFGSLLYRIQSVLLAAWGIVALAIFAVHIYLLYSKTERGIPSQLLGVLGLTMSSPLVSIVSSGSFRHGWLALWLMNFLFFCTGIFYVKMKVRALSERRAFRNWLEKVWFGKDVLLSHLVILSGAVALAIAGLAPGAAPLALVPIMAQAIAGTMNLSSRLNIRRLGLIELGHSILFGLIVVMVFAPHHGGGK